MKKKNYLLKNAPDTEKIAYTRARIYDEYPNGFEYLSKDVFKCLKNILIKYDYAKDAIIRSKGTVLPGDPNAIKQDL